MSLFSGAQLEKVFVDLFKEQEYDYEHAGCISRDLRDVLLYGDLRDFLFSQYHLFLTKLLNP